MKGDVMDNESSVVRVVAGQAVPLVGNDIDTDRIIPARFLRCVTFAGLGEQVFRDERFHDDGSPKEHPFNDPAYCKGSILIVNRNFGCGSSREHAPQALMRWGIKAIIGESFAEIFAGNCSNLGVPAFTAPASVVRALQEMVQGDHELLLMLDVETGKLKIGEARFQLELSDSARTALLGGTWDTLAQLLKNEGEIEKVCVRLPYTSWR